MIKMQNERLKRYKDKLELIQERIQDIEKWKGNKKTQELLKDRKTTLATYKAFQEIIESSMDITAMMLKDSGRTVKDDYENINKLEQQEILSKDLANSLREANGLRNRLVHDYNGLEGELAFKSIKKLIPKFKEFQKQVQSWIQKQ